MLSFCYFVGGTLEREWGTAKFTLYYLSGMLFSVLSTVILSLATGYYGWSQMCIRDSCWIPSLSASGGSAFGSHIYSSARLLQR